MILSITGHRPHKLNNEYDLNGPCTRYCKKEIIKIIESQNPDKGMSGMALGIDTLYCLILIEIGIPFIAAIPCMGQDKIWPKKSRDLYNNILSNSLCMPVFIDDGSYAGYKMIKRDHWMVDNSDKIIAVYDGSNGGTGKTVNYAISKNKDILYINPRGYLNPQETKDIS